MISSRRRPTAAAAILLVLLFADGNCDNHIPSLNEISRINDPVLKEVFSSSGLHKQGTRSPNEDRPRLPEPGPPQPQVEPYYGEVPIDHQQPLGPVPHQQRPDAVAMVVDTGVNAFATGANALYRGAATVGQAFGINTQSYEAPLFSAASQFLGRK
ncbi:hypothetical protein ANCDUO_04074 [Ancylostoma duodenale]|uniref:Peptidase A1 domain-containing protein n=1 Tax=Ancylostoma duodenale TaxID=51022 RepID=A0A0C2D7H3_9BILA|nr:hypothetical protein ANCDUO_04074 [Ancylostoma duodenale]